MKLRTIFLFAVCALSLGLCGCGGESAPVSEEQQAEMENDMQEMQMMLPQNPSETTVTTPEATTPSQPGDGN